MCDILYHTEYQRSFVYIIDYWRWLIMVCLLYALANGVIGLNCMPYFEYYHSVDIRSPGTVCTSTVETIEQQQQQNIRSKFIDTVIWFASIPTYSREMHAFIYIYIYMYEYVKWFSEGPVNYYYYMFHLLWLLCTYQSFIFICSYMYYV